jgi:hypothetical protein
MNRTKSDLPELEHREHNAIKLEPTFHLACEMVLHEYIHGDYPEGCGEIIHLMYEKLLRYEREHRAYIRSVCGTVK